MRLFRDSWPVILGVGVFGMIGTWLRVMMFDLFSMLKVGGSESYAHIIATFTVNVLGAFGIGLLSVMSEKRKRPQLMLWWGTGMMGGFTTFSTMMRDMYVLFTMGGNVDRPVTVLALRSSMLSNTAVYDRLIPTLIYLMITMSCGLVCVWFGRWGAQKWLH